MMKPAVREPLLDTIKLVAMTEALKGTFQAMPRCECCYEYRHVVRDGYGGVAMLCLRCDYQVRAAGCCALHHSRMYYPELANEHEARGGGVVVTPIEIERLYVIAESTRPKYDPAELVDADV